MPGIAGVVYRQSTQENRLIPPMLQILSHRAFNKQQQIESFQNIQVGITGGNFSRYKSTLLALDGSIFSRKKLCEELESKGYQTQQASDEMLFLYAYEAWGNRFLEHVDGDFALALIDEQKHLLLIARDRIGKKPLYWFHNEHYFIFASELKAILASGAVPRTPSSEAIASYLYFGYIPQDLSPIENVNKLLPAYYLQLNRNHSKTIHSYWSYSAHFKELAHDDRETILKHVDTLLTDAIAERIPQTRPVGCCVSGGIGSAATAFYLEKVISPEQMQAFTIFFRKEDQQTVQAVDEISKNLHLKDHQDDITPQNYLEDLAKIVWFLDEPIADPHAVAIWKLAQLAKRASTLFLGLGSDELLAGHQRYRIESEELSYFSSLKETSQPFIRNLLLPFIHLFSRQGAYTLLQRARKNPWQLSYINKNALFNMKQLQAAAPRIAFLFDPHVFIHKFHNLPRTHSTVSAYMYLDVKTRLADSALHQYDRLLSAHQLNWHAPFLAKSIVEYLASLPAPDQLKEKDPFSIIKELLKNTFPPSVINRSHRSHIDLMKQWSEFSGLSQHFQKLTKGSLVETGIISERWLKQQLATTETRKKAFTQLWALLQLEIWFRLFINSSVQSHPPQTNLEDLL